MAKKRSWFQLVKRFFTSDPNSSREKAQNETTRSRWIFLGRFKVKSRLASISGPSPPREKTRLSEAGEKHRKHALNVALATAAAAEAAVAAAQVAADVVLFTGLSQSTQKYEKEAEENSAIKIQDDAPHSTYQYKTKIQEFAALKIQATFRGYLARKVLRALKGIVRLQAIIRGRNVRRQAMNTLKCLQSIVNIHSQVCARRIQMTEETCPRDENKQLQNLKDKIIKMDKNSQRQWNGSILTTEEAEALFLSKKEAAIKRERIKEYSFSYQNSAETERNKINARWRYWLEQSMDTQVSKSKELEDLDSVLVSNPKSRVEYRGKQNKMRGIQKQNHIEGLMDSPMAAPRRSFHRKQCSLGEENSFTFSPVVPAYMAATESAKAKARSMSSPKLRQGRFDAYSDSYSPFKNKLSLISSTDTELPSSTVRSAGRPSAYQRRSPSIKGIPGPAQPTGTLKDLSFDSEGSLRTWDHQQSAFI